MVHGMVELMTIGYMNGGDTRDVAYQKAVNLYNWDGVTNVNWQDATRRKLNE